MQAVSVPPAPQLQIGSASTWASWLWRPELVSCSCLGGSAKGLFATTMSSSNGIFPQVRYLKVIEKSGYQVNIPAPDCCCEISSGYKGPLEQLDAISKSSCPRWWKVACGLPKHVKSHDGSTAAPH